jgi:hypothetical protein
MAAPPPGRLAGFQEAPMAGWESAALDEDRFRIVSGVGSEVVARPTGRVARLACAGSWVEPPPPDAWPADWITIDRAWSASRRAETRAAA